MCTLHAVVVLCFGCWQGLANRSMRIQDLYVGAFPIPRFISLFFKSYARAHVSVYPHTPTRIRTRTHIGSSSERTEHSRRGHPCSMCPRLRETSADALPFLKVLSTHRISRSGPRLPTFSPFSPAPPPPPQLPAPHQNHTQKRSRGRSIQNGRRTALRAPTYMHVSRADKEGMLLPLPVVNTP